MNDFTYQETLVPAYGNPERINNMVKSELNFKIGEEVIWMPIQKALEKALALQDLQSGRLIIGFLVRLINPKI